MTSRHTTMIYDWRPQRETPAKHGAKATNFRIANCDRNYARGGRGIVAALAASCGDNVETDAITRIFVGQIDA